MKFINLVYKVLENLSFNLVHKYINNNGSPLSGVCSSMTDRKNDRLERNCHCLTPFNLTERSTCSKETNLIA